MANKIYRQRDIKRLEEKGNYYTRHVCALDEQYLFGKSEIAAELAWRDCCYDELKEFTDKVCRLLTEYEETKRQKWLESMSAPNVK